MKRPMILISILLAGFIASCSGYDDSSLWNAVDEAQKRIKELTESLGAVEEQAALLSAAKNGGVITGISPNAGGGYTVSYRTADGKDATAVIASTSDLSETDIIGTKEEDGVLYWTLTSGGKTVVLTDSDGAKLPVAGRAPSFSTDKDGWWMVNGAYILDGNGEKIKSNGRSASLVSKLVQNGDGTVTFVLADGSLVTVGTEGRLALRIFLNSEEVKSEVRVKDGATSLEFTYSLEGKAAEGAILKLYRTENLSATLGDGKIDVTLPANLHKAMFSLLVSDAEGNMIVRMVRLKGKFGVDSENDLWKVTEEKTLAEGCNYYSMEFKTIKRRMHVLEIDLKSPAVEVTTSFADDIIPNPNANSNKNNGFNLRETLSQLCARKTAAGEAVIGGVNTGYFDSNYGIARGPHIENGELLYMNSPYVVSSLPNHSWAFTIFSDGTASCGKKSFSGKIEVSGKEIPFYTVNDTIVRGANASRMKSYPVNIYTSRYRRTPHPEKPQITNPLSSKALYVVAKYVSGNMKVNQGWAEAEVVSVQDGRSDALTEPPYLDDASAVAIQAFGSAADDFASLKAGDRLRLSAEMSVEGVVKPIVTQNSTMWHYVTDGENTLSTVPPDHDFRKLSDPMTFVCVDRSGSRIMIAEIDGRQTGFSIGVNAQEVVDIALRLGAWNSTRFDGGGSSSMWLLKDGVPGLVSSPSDSKGERSCMNYMYVRLKK